MKHACRELDVAPPLRAAPEGPAAGAAAERMGLHGDVDGASATLQAAWPAPPHLTSRTSSRPGLRCVFCGINPGRVSAAAAAHFANPRNDFWRLLHDGGFTPRLYDPQEQFALLELGYGVTNAAYRTTPGSGDLRRGDFDAARLERSRASCGRGRSRSSARRPTAARSASGPSSARRSRTLGDDRRSSSSRRPRPRTRRFRTPSGCVVRALRDVARAAAARGRARARASTRTSGCC